MPNSKKRKHTLLVRKLTGILPVEFVFLLQKNATNTPKKLGQFPYSFSPSLAPQKDLIPYKQKYSLLKLTKLLLLFCFLVLSLPLYATPIDSLMNLPPTASEKEKMGLRNRIDAFFENIKEEEEQKSFARKYHQLALASNDSIFISNSYYYLGNFQKQKEIQRKYGWHLDNSQLETTLYNELNIYHDQKGNATFEDIKNNVQWVNNNTKETDYDYDPNEVYWGKVLLYGEPEKTEDYLIHFSTHRYFSSWESIDTWVVHANDSIRYAHTGDQFEETEKPIPSKANMLRFSIQPNEKVVLYFRLQGTDEEKLNKPDHLSLALLKEDMWPGFFPNYPFKGKYRLRDTTKPFTTNVILNHEFYHDSSGTSTIEEVMAKQKELAWKSPASLSIEADKVYWLRHRFYGSPYFNGEQILHVSPLQGFDLFSFDFIDTYISSPSGGYQHQRAGDHVPLENRAYKHWANFIKMDIGPTDTLDLWIRMEGADSRFIIPNRAMLLHHVDPFSLFPSQGNYALANGLFYGIIGIQTIFFFLLFVIEKEQNYLYLSIMGFGFFINYAFDLSAGVITHEFFPVWRDYQVPMYFLGLFFICLGVLKFVETYFSYPKDSLYAKWLVPGLIYTHLVASLYALFQFKFYDENLNAFTEETYYLVILLLVVVSIVTVLIAALKAPSQKNISKKYLFLAFTPLIISSLGFLSTSIYASIMETTSIISHYFLLGLNASVVSVLTLLAISIGHRTNRFKAEKAAALQKNLDDQKRRLLEQERVNQAISRFVPNEFLSALGKTNITEIKLGDTIQKEVTVFFSDIRNYTSLSEQMTPEDNFKFVNAYNGRMGPIIQQNSGFVNQYLGDGIMAIFPNTPNEALQAAIEMQKAIQLYNKQRVAQGKGKIKVGMGMHTGSLIMGITGDKNRMDAATISDSVNSASRIENLTKHYGTSILLSDASLKKIKNHASFHFRYLGEVQVKGKLEALKIYECFDGDLPKQKALKMKTLPIFEQGIHSYFNKDFAKATLKFERVLAQNPNDQTAKIFLNKARTLDEVGVTEDWTGVELMLEK